MKLLLIEDIESLGRSGDIVNVKSGYARNFLVPKKKGVFANKHALRMQVRLQKERKQKAEQDKKESNKIATQLEGMAISTTAKVDPEGHMYGSVTALDIVHLLKEHLKIELDKNCVKLKQPIKKTGVYTIVFKLKEDVSASFTLKVVSEGGVPQEKSEEAQKETKEVQEEAKEEAQQ